ncbi:MAG: TolC family protein, partial [Acidobacteriota bacterium]
MTSVPDRTTHRPLALLLAATTFAAAAVVPARAEPLRLTLGEAIARALSDGTAAQLARLEVDRASRLEDRARSALRPRLEASLGYSNQSLNFETFGFVFPGTDPLVPPFYVIDARIGAAVDIVALAARRRVEAARHGVAVSTEERRAAENDVAAAVASLYVAVQASRAQVDETQANTELFARVEASTQRQLDAGVVTRVDLERAQMQLARQRDALLAARNQESRARLAFLQAIGAPLDAEPALTDPVLARQGEAMALEQALAAARARRPELAADAERLRAAEAELAGAKARRLPTLALQALAEYNGNYFNN